MKRQALAPEDRYALARIRAAQMDEEEERVAGALALAHEDLARRKGLRCDLPMGWPVLDRWSRLGLARIRLAARVAVERGRPPNLAEQDLRLLHRVCLVVEELAAARWAARSLGLRYQPDMFGGEAVDLAADLEEADPPPLRDELGPFDPRQALDPLRL